MQKLLVLRKVFPVSPVLVAVKCTYFPVFPASVDTLSSLAAKINSKMFILSANWRDKKGYIDQFVQKVVSAKNNVR